MTKPLKHKGFFIFAGAGALCVAFVLLLFVSPLYNAQEAPIQSTKKNLAQLRAISGMEIVNYEYLIEGYTLEQLMEESTCVVYGQVTEIAQPFKVRSAEGGLRHITEVIITPTQVLRGDSQASTLTLRLFGGLIGNVYEEYGSMPELVLNEDYLLFLHKNTTGGSFNTPGDYYYLTGMIQGAFKALSPGEIFPGENPALRALSQVPKDDTLFVNMVQMKNGQVDVRSSVALLNAKDVQALSQAETFPGQAVFSLQTLLEIMPSFNETHPVDPDVSRTQSIEAMESNLANGMITQEEYDKLFASLNQYAEIVPDDYEEPIDPETAAEKERIRQALREEEENRTESFVKPQ